MRRQATVAIIICLVSVLPALTQAASTQSVELQFFLNQFVYLYNGQPVPMDVTPVNHDGRILLPVRYIADAIGANVAWDPTTKKVTIQDEQHTIELWIDNPTARVNGASVLTDPDNPTVHPIILHGRTMIPLRFVVENLGATISWDPDTRCATVTVTASSPTNPPATVLTAWETEMLQLINHERTTRGLPALTIHYGLVRLARLKSQDLINLDYFAHISPTYGSPFDMMQQAGIDYSTAAENIAGAATPQRAHALLMNSPDHRSNILNPAFSYIGLGTIQGSKYGAIHTQMFIGL